MSCKFAEQALRITDRKRMRKTMNSQISVSAEADFWRDNYNFQNFYKNETKGKHSYEFIACRVLLITRSCIFDPFSFAQIFNGRHMNARAEKRALVAMLRN